MDSDTDESISDDGDVLFSEDFSSEIVEDTSSFEGLTIDSELEDSDDSFEEESLPEIEDDDDDDDDDDGADGDDEDDEDDEDDDEVYEEILPEDLRRHSPSSVASPLTKRRRSSISDTFMQLEELLERTNRQITNIYEAVSRMHEFCGVSQMERCRKCGEPLSPAVQAVEGQDNPDRRVLQPVAEDNREKLVPDTDLDPRDGGAQEINTVTISSNQPAVEAPLVFQKPLDSIPTNEIPDFTEVIIRNNTVMMSNPTSEENQQDSFNPPVYHNFGIPVIPEAVLVNNPETVNYPPSTANTSGHQNLFSSTGPTTAPEIKEVVLVEMPEKTEVVVDGNKQTVYCPALLGNVVPPDAETIAASIASKSVIEKLVLVEMPIDPECIVDGSPEKLNNPIVVQHVQGQDPAAASLVPLAVELLDNEANNAQGINNLLLLENDGGQAMPCCVCIHSGVEEYLGNPRRNIRLPKFHLLTAKNKPTPTYAACYLANVIFSEEILTLSSVTERTSRYIFMDQNKMSAIREYLLTVFPNYDLRERGKDWKDCISAVSFMIESLYTEAEIPANRNVSVPMSTNWCAGINNDAGEGPSQWLQDVRESVRRERVDFEHIPEGNGNAAIHPDQLVFIGDPSRDIHIPYSVLKIAKTHLRPDLAAKYIILHLFPEEVLIESNVYGNMQCGLFALDSNRIDALREFLQDNYPEHDLEETGYHWKLCVTAINSCLQILRQGPRNVTV
uniref:BEN domain-containing protein n=1 Tax=Rattus norvegicus TaxID=10116 RepID=A0ABK0LJC5_RAT